MKTLVCCFAGEDGGGLLGTIVAGTRFKATGVGIGAAEIAGAVMKNGTGGVGTGVLGVQAPILSAAARLTSRTVAGLAFMFGISDPSIVTLQGGLTVPYSRVSISYRGLGEYLRGSAELRTALLAHAAVGARFAKSIAPVGPPRDKHRHEFRDSIHAATSTAPGGYITARIFAAPVWVEFGRKHVNPYVGAHVLRRTAQYLNAPKRRA